MSTERSTAGTRRARSRKRRGRAFLGAFAIVVGALVVASLVGAGVGSIQGPRATAVQVDPQAAVAASGSRLIVTTTQSLEKVDAARVSVSPAAPFTVDTSGRTVGVRFTLPLHDDTDYTVTIDGVTGLGGGPATTLTETFHTPPIDVYLLRRGDGQDTIFRTDLAGQNAQAVFTDSHIEDFRATTEHLVVSVRTAQDRASLIVMDPDGQNARPLKLPGNGYVSNLQSADKGELIGYTYSDASLTAGSGRESALFTASLRADAADAAPTQIAVAGSDPRVSEWRFVPDTDSILLLTFDSRLSLTSASGKNPVSLGSATNIDGIARGSSHAIVMRVDGPAEIDLADGSEKPLVTPDTDVGKVGDVTPLPGEAGTLRTIAQLKDATTLVGTTVAVVAPDGKTTPVLQVPSTDSVLQTCVSPSGRYAAVLTAPGAASNPYDRYQLPLPGTVQTRIVDLTAVDQSAAQVSTLTGFDTSWCQVPPR